MTSPFDRAISAGLASRRVMSEVAVSYSDGSQSGSVSAVRGQPDVRTADALAVQMADRYVDWMIKVEDLQAIKPALTLPPARGHAITVDGDTYTVSSFEGGPAWEYVDGGETEYRIHTIKTGDV